MRKLLLISFVFVSLFSCQNKERSLHKITAKTKLIDSSTAQDSAIIKRYLPYKDKMIKEINTVLSYAPKNYTRTDGELQSTLGNFLADVCFDKANEIFKSTSGNVADFALFNYGGIRAGITKGSITFENAFKLMPFENTLVVVELSSSSIEDLVAYFIKAKRAHPLSRQVQLNISKDKHHFLINGKPIQKDKTYHVVTSNYLLNGGDNMNFFKDRLDLFETEYLMRKAIADGFKKQDTLKVKLDKRIVIN